MKLTKNFDLNEFRCHDGTPVPDKLIPNVKKLAKNLQVLRDDIGAPVYVQSGYRTKKWNVYIGGSTNSFHMAAMAADIVVRDIPAYKVRAAIVRLIKAGKMTQGGIGSYAGFTHYDIRGTAARWSA